MRAGLNILVAGAHPGRQDHPAQLPGRRHPRRRARGQRRGGLRAALPAPRLGGDADPAERAGGHRRDQAARPGQGEPADAAEPDHRRRGAGRGVPRPAARAQRRACPGMCTLHANSAREALVKMCTLPLLAGENVSARFVVPTVAASVDLVVHLGIDQHGVRRVNEIVGVPGPGRERRDRDRADLRARAAASCGGPAGCRRGRAATSGSASTSTPSSTGRADGRPRRARRRCRPAAGLVGVRPAAPRAPRAPHAARASRSCSPGAGLGHVSRRRRSSLLCVVCWRASAALLMQVVTRTPPVALLFGAMGGVPPGARGVRRGRGAASASSRRSGPRPSTTSPRAVRAGLSLPDALAAAVGPRARSRCGSSFDAFALDYQVTGRFGECLDRLKDRLADPVGDRVVEGLRIAREVGGGELGRLLRNLSGLPPRRGAHPLRDRGAPGLDRQRRPARGRRALAGPADDELPDRRVIRRYASPAGTSCCSSRPAPAWSPTG